MVKFFKGSIQLKVLAIEVVVLSITITLSTSFDYSYRVENEEAAFKIRAEQTIASLKHSLILPVWNYSNEDIVELLNSSVAQPHVWKAQVTDAEGNVLAEARDQGPDLDYEPLLMSLDIQHKDRVLGKVHLLFDETPIRETLRASLTAMITRSVISLVVIVIATFLFLQNSILNKIYRLSQQSNKMKNQDLDSEFNWQSGDELDNLGEGLEATRRSLKGLIESLGAKNRELNELTHNLEKLVAEKSAQVVHQSRLASLGELSASMAHEVNNPLGIISTSSDVLKKFIKNNPNLESRLDSIDRAVVRIEKIVGGLRKFSRTSGSIVNKIEPIQAIAKEALQLVDAKSRRDMVPIDVMITSDSLIQCDPIEIEQVMVNLINNGIDACKKLPERWLKLLIFDENEEVVVRVIDSGAGIPLPIQEKLFQPFFTTKPVGEGTGLGLSIVKGILENHGARLFVNNDMKNTCFEVRFAKATAVKKTENGGSHAA